MIICENIKNPLTSFEELTVGDIFKDQDGDYYLRIHNIDNGYQEYNCVNLRDGCLDCFSSPATVTKINTAKLVVE